MAHIVMVTYGINSYLNASFNIATGLREREHRVTYVSGLDAAAAVEAQGFEFVLLEQEYALRSDPERQQLEQLPARKRYLQRSGLIRVGQKQRDYYLGNRELVDTVSQLAPDVLLIDEELPEAIIQLSGIGIPFLLVQYINSTRWRPGHPPVSTFLMPDKTWMGKLKIAAAWNKIWLKRRLIDQFASWYYAGTDRRSILKALASQHGSDYYGAEHYHWFPIVFPQFTTLFLEAIEFDFSPPNRVDGVYVGPMVWHERTESVDEKNLELVREFLGEISRTQRPLVYCSLGTYWQIDVSFLREVIRVFEQRLDWGLIVSLGGKTAVEQFGAVPDNVLICSYVPQLQVLKESSLMLTHGGIGTINECIFHGVPMIVYSTGKMEQNGSAARVVYHGMGAYGHIEQATASDIAAQIEHVLSHSDFQANVARMQAVYQQYQRENKAVVLIEQLIEKVR